MLYTCARKLVHSNANTREFGDRKLVRFFGHSWAPRWSLDMLLCLPHLYQQCRTHDSSDLRLSQPATFEHFLEVLGICLGGFGTGVLKLFGQVCGCFWESSGRC